MKPPLLIVDDEKNVLLAMQDYFAAHGYDADCARDKQEAERLLTTRSYAVLITDLRLTGSDDAEGLDIARFALERQPAPRCILLTAHGSREIETLAYRYGIDVCLFKPQPLNHIAEIVSLLLQKPTETAALHIAPLSV